MFSRIVPYLVVSLIAVVLGGPFRAYAVEPRAGENVSWTGTVDDDIFSAGRHIDVDATVSGDAFLAGGEVSTAGVLEDSAYAAGGRLRLTSDVADDLIAAGGQIDTDGHIGDNLIVAGGQITILSEVGGKAIASGGQVTLDRTAVVHGDAWLTGGKVALDGDVGGGARVTGDDIVIRGHVAGDVRARGQLVRVVSGAHIDGTLEVFSPSEPEIADGAVIAGTVDYQKTAARPNWIGVAIVGIIVATLIVYFYLFVVGLLIILICPGFVRRNAEILAKQGFTGFGIGALFVLLAPVVLLAFAITVIGIPFAFLMLLVYATVLMLSVPFAGTTLAYRFAGYRGSEISRGRVVLAYVGVLLVFWLLGLIPFLGSVLWMLLTMLGIGVVIVQVAPMFRRMRSGVEPL
jgi:hypothetical protein